MRSYNPFTSNQLFFILSKNFGSLPGLIPVLLLCFYDAIAINAWML